MTHARVYTCARTRYNERMMKRHIVTAAIIASVMNPTPAPVHHDAPAAAPHMSLGYQVDESPVSVDLPYDPDYYISDVYDYQTAYYACTQYGWEPAIVARCQWSAAIYFHIPNNPRHYNQRPGAAAIDA